MTKIKLCGLSRDCDIEWANELRPDYVGFVFAKKSKRYVSPELAAELRAQLDSDIKTVGVFVNEPLENVVALLKSGTINVAQLHGKEDEDYIAALRKECDSMIFKAFRIDTQEDIDAAEKSSADFVLLDSGNGGTGTVFDWSLLKSVKRPYFLAGGLNTANISEAVKEYCPYGVDVSSGIETDGLKDKNKMAAFVAAVRKE